MSSSLRSKATIRIAYLIPEWPGQTHIWMWREICHLREMGAEVIVYATQPPPERDRARHAFAAKAADETRYLWPRSSRALLADILSTLGRRPIRVARALCAASRLPVSSKPGWKTALPVVLAASEMAAMVRRDQITHVHVASAARCALVAMSLKRISDVPYSLTINANVDWWGGAMREKFDSADLVVSIAKWLCDDIRRVAPHLPPERLELAPVGVDTHAWPQAERLWPPATEQIKLISVGRLHVSKGHDTVLEAMSRLRGRGHAVHLTILGDGPDRLRLESLIQSLHLSGIVELRGSVDEATVRSTMCDSHIFVLASHNEPLGVVYMEAMATGIPTIGTDAGGVREIISDGLTGYLVPPKSPDALVHRIESVLTDPASALKVGAAGRLFIEQTFDSRIGAKRLLDAIRRVNCKATALPEPSEARPLS